MSRIMLALAMLSVPALAAAVPILQVGAPAGITHSGLYADYADALPEEDTAYTSGSILLVAGQYKNGGVLNVGGQSGSGPNWSNYTDPSVFPGSFDTVDGAILLASIPDGSLNTGIFTLLVNGQSAFHSSASLSLFPNNHFPVKDTVSDFLFFNIGDFADLDDTVPNFDESDAADTGVKKDGEIKTLALTILGLEWIHFDVMALVTTDGKASLESTLFNNPGSHDVTWFAEGLSSSRNFVVVPEPSSLILLAAGLVGLAICRRKMN